MSTPGSRNDHRAPAPRLSLWILRRVCSSPHLEMVEGDLVELYRARLSRSGAVVAGLRSVADALSLLRSPYSRRRPDGAPTRSAAPGHPRPLESRAPRPAPGGRLSPPDPRPSHSTAPVEVQLDSLLRDLRFAWRSLRQAPGFTAVVVLTLALGIGANSAIFSVVNGVLLRSLPYPEPERIVQLDEIMPNRGRSEIDAVTGAVFRTLRDDAEVFEQIAMYNRQSTTLTGVETPVRLSGAAVSVSLFPLLGVDPLVGRAFTPEEGTPGNDKVVVLSHKAWRGPFGGDRSIVGERILLDDEPMVVVGIMPPDFEFPEPGIDYWVPLPVREAREQDLGGGVVARMEMVAPAIARLADGVSLEQAETVASAFVRNYRESLQRQIEEARQQAGQGGGRRGFQPPPGARAGGRGKAPAEQRIVTAGPPADADDGGIEPGMEITVLQEEMVREVRPSLLLLMGAVGFVLLIACANVANLMMARSTVRTRETAVRAALGASGGQLVRLLLVEGLVLSLVGAAVGLALAFASLRVLTASAPEFIPRVQEIGIDPWSLGFTLAVAVVTALLFTLFPARGAARLDLTSALKEGSADSPGRLLGRSMMRRLLVAAEVALSVVLLVGAGLLVSSFVRLATVDPGFDADNLLAVELELPSSVADSGPVQFNERLVEAVRALDGVTAVSAANTVPAFPTRLRIRVDTDQRQRANPDQEPPVVGIRLVDDDFFETVGTRLLEGRTFSDQDREGTQPVAVMSRAAAAGMYPGESAIGQELRFFGSEPAEIVGVVEDFRAAGVEPDPQPELYLLYRQAPERLAGVLGGTVNLLMRTDVTPLRLVPALRARLPEVVPGMPAAQIMTMRSMLAEEIAEPRFYAGMVGAFAVLALVLAAVGIYGVLSYSVQQRVQETAIRRALGAGAGQVLLRVVRQGMLLAAAGLAVGLVGSLALRRVLEAMLYEVTATDPLTYAAVTLVFLGVALLAVWVPARRATRIDPMRVLRYEA